MPDVILELLGTRGCHLCEQAEAVVKTAAATRGISWRYVDIAGDDDLMTHYAERIPVLRRVDGESEIGWPFGLLDVMRLVAMRR